MKKVIITGILVCVSLMLLSTSILYQKFMQRVERCEPYPLTAMQHAHNDSITKIIVIGDSWGDLANKYNIPEYIDSLMYTKGIKTITKAKGEHGATSRKIYNNMHYDGNDINSTKPLIENTPQYAILFCGVNDSHGQYGKDFYAYHTSLIVKEMLHHNIKPIILELPHYDIERQYGHYSFTKRSGYRLLSFMSDRTFYINNITRYRTEIKKNFTEQGIIDKVTWISIDTFSKQKCYDNSMHLNNHGYQCLANIIVEIIFNDIKKTENGKLSH